MQQAGNATPCFVSDLLEEHCNSNQPNAREDEIDIRGAAGTLYFGKFCSAPPHHPILIHP